MRRPRSTEISLTVALSSADTALIECVATLRTVQRDCRDGPRLFYTASYWNR